MANQHVDVEVPDDSGVLSADALSNVETIQFRDRWKVDAVFGHLLIAILSVICAMIHRAAVARIALPIFGAFAIGRFEDGDICANGYPDDRSGAHSHYSVQTTATV